MNIRHVGATAVVLFGLVGAVWSAQKAIEGEIDERVSEAKEKTDRSVSFVSAAHRLDMYESKAEVAEKHLELLRAIGAEEHKIEAAKKEVQFWQSEAHEARKAVTE